MEQSLFQGVSPQERKEYLVHNCYKVVENHNYTRKLTEQELTDAKDTLVDISITMDAEDEKIKSIKKEFADRKKENMEIKKDVLSQIRFEAVSQTGTVYLIDDQDSGMMGIYNEEGLLVDTRPLQRNERQTSILTVLNRKAE